MELKSNQLFFSSPPFPNQVIVGALFPPGKLGVYPCRLLLMQVASCLLRRQWFHYYILLTFHVLNCSIATLLLHPRIFWVEMLVSLPRSKLNASLSV